MPMAWRIWTWVRPNRREAATAAAITWKLAPPQPRLTPCGGAIRKAEECHRPSLCPGSCSCRHREQPPPPPAPGRCVARVAAAIGVAVVVVVQVPGHHAIGKGRHIGRGLLAAHTITVAGVRDCTSSAKARATEGAFKARHQGAPNGIQNQALGPFDHLRQQVFVGEVCAYSTNRSVSWSMRCSFHLSSHASPQRGAPSSLPRVAECTILVAASVLAYPSIPRSFAAVPPRILIRSSSLSPGIAMTWSTGAVFHGNG